MLGFSHSKTEDILVASKGDGGSSALEEVRSLTLAPPSRHHYRIATYPKTKPFTPPPAVKSYVLPSSALTEQRAQPEQHRAQSEHNVH